MNKNLNKPVTEVSQLSAHGAAQIVPVGYKQTEVGVIPVDWEASTVGDEFYMQLGKMLDENKNTGQLKTLLGNRSVKWGAIDTSSLSAVRLEVSELARYRLIYGDILVCEGGEVGRSTIWKNEVAECYFQKALHRLRPKSGYNSELFINILYWIATKDGFQNFVTQTSIAHLPKDKFETLPIPIPSQDEQTAIANALSDVDALLSELENLIAKKQAIKTATMQQLLTGRTRLPQFAKHADGSAKGYKASELGEIPEGWESVHLGEIAKFLKGTGLPKSELIDSGAYSCIHYGQLFTTYTAKIKHVLSTTNFNGPIKSEANDILMPTSDVTPNGLATASCILNADIVLGGDILIIRAVGNQLDGIFFAYLITIMRDQVMQLVTGSTVYHLYGRDMATFFFAKPSLEEQTAIATILSDMDAEIQALEQRLNKTRHIKQGMMQQLLTGKIRLVRPTNEESDNDRTTAQL